MSFVRSVTGDIAPSAVGPVMFHEHLLFDFVPPGGNDCHAVAITPENRWQIDYLSNANPTNARQGDPAVAAAELAAFGADGGGLIVDQSVIGIGRNPVGLVQASLSSRIPVVAATGTYTARYLQPELREAGVETLAALFVSEICDGIGDTGIRAGLIGEIGCSWPPEPVEERALQAAALTQQQTGAAISVHPGRNRAACSRILDVLETAGADLSRVVLCHMDRTHPDGDGIAPLLDRGAVVEWDFFGIEQSHYWIDRKSVV